jgi:DNA (cytosine-5)-methyltransferase 1
MRAGGLFAGYGGLDMAVEEVFGAKPAWFSELDPNPSRVLAHRWPKVPNHGDVTAIDWASVEPVEIVALGFPCTDVSGAGLRLGLRPDTRSGLWNQAAYAVGRLRPRYVVIENVRGLCSARAHSDVEPCPWCLGDGRTGPALRALGAVLGDLASLGYDARWCGLPASAVGAPHPRFRVFILAEDTNLAARGERRFPAPGQAEGGRPRADASRRGGASVADAHGVVVREPEVSQPGSGTAPFAESVGASSRWGRYGDAIERWESILGRRAPSPTDPSPRGGNRLAPRFVEWMMGLPAGHVTDVPGLDRNAQLKALGNGVVPQQAAAAIRHLLSLESA